MKKETATPGCGQCLMSADALGPKQAHEMQVDLIINIMSTLIWSLALNILIMQQKEKERINLVAIFASTTELYSSVRQKY